ncbi:hypothetical protein UAJ10_15120 [Nitrospirillum sp. BR 11164]|uniref:hypothetical protein n=1 Tax=Nitrospirillum sp. BR 11164 TaxID=3104324 RepID=UPI002B002F2E|nr:hypothetical protein [Nitrospirillum sp. BR 11164]MEA1650336.1 hypothetical protein [Nitrospirillum sp. BR 11164]
MSISYRLSYAAAVGALTTLWSSVGFPTAARLPIEQDSIANQGYGEANQIKHPEYVSIPDPVSVAKETGHQEKYRAICSDPEDDAKAQLCQQWRSAEGTLEQADYIPATFWISIGGLVVNGLAFVALILTLNQTRRAADKASEGVDEARIANKIAESSAKENTELVRRSIIESDRAWVNVSAHAKNINISSECVEIDVVISIANCGNTVAPRVIHYVNGYGGIAAASHGIEIAKKQNMVLLLGIMHFDVIFPNGTISFDRKITVTSDDIIRSMEIERGSLESGEEIAESSICIVCSVYYILPGDRLTRYSIFTFGIYDDEAVPAAFSPHDMLANAKAGLHLKLIGMLTEIS